MKTENREEMMEISPFADQISTSFPFSGGIFDFTEDGGGERSSLGFTELLGLQDFPQSLFELPPPTPVLDAMSLPPESSETVNFPATPNSSSISSSSTEAANDADPAKTSVTAPVGDMEELDKAKKTFKGGKKKGQKRQREPQFAFMTKSEVDHLEDGYRWRKYGQKAVKNSPFPRSYYRCTTAMCGVKKRLERSSKDPTVVVTTYEGQHTHPSPAVQRGGQLVQPPPPIPEHFSMQLNELHLPFFSSYLPPPPPLDFRHVTATAPSSSGIITAASYRKYCNPTADIEIRDHGLLQDVIPSDIRKKEE